MTKEIRERACRALMCSNRLGGSYLKKIYVVGNEISWFLNAAKRVAYGTRYVIETITLEEACQFMMKPLPDHKFIDSNFDQNGAIYPGGRLFCNNPNVYVS